MKQYIIHILIFFVFIVCIDLSVGFVGDYMQRNSHSGETEQFNDLCLEDKHDVLIMGSSRANHHYVPEILEDSLGLDVYNAGYDGNGIILSYGILQMVLQRYTPKCIIYEVTAGYDIFKDESDDDDKRYISRLKPYYDDENVADILKTVSPTIFVESHSGLYRYNSNLIALTRDYVKTDSLSNKGYLPLYGKMSTVVHHNNNTPVVDPIKKKYLDLFVRDCKDHNIKIIFALSPRYVVNVPEGYQCVRNLAAGYNVPLIDCYSDELFHQTAFFKDGAHLNNDGAVKYTRHICSTISSLLTNNSN